MKDKFLLLGSEGSMGKRYSAILNFLNIKFTPYDIRTNPKVPSFKKFTHIMICTPTDTHFSILEKLIPLNKIILCEKPISKSITELLAIRDLLLKSESKLTMMMQYQKMIPLETRENYNIKSHSHYDYYKTGNDSLAWDCLQIIALARDGIHLGNTSPIWTCIINGKKLELSDMDLAYVRFLESWIKGNEKQNISDIIEHHRKVKRLINDRNSKGPDCNTSKV